MNIASQLIAERFAPSLFRALAGIAIAVIVGVGHQVSAFASVELANIAIPPAGLAVRGKLPALPAGEAELKFSEMFKMPIGPKGLEPTEKLLSLNGKRVRLVGYMAGQEESAKGVIILAPMPVTLGDEDESLSDDLPGNAVFVHLTARYADKPVPNMQGLLHLTGTLQLGPKDEADGHVSAIRLTLDDNTSRLLTTAAPPANSNKQRSTHKPAKSVASAP